MFKIIFMTFMSAIAFSSLSATCCCQSVDLSVGWRRDSLDWKLSDLKSRDGYSYGYSCGCDDDIKSDILFKDINSYTISGKSRWAGSAYYVRLSGEYGLTDKGRAHEIFKIDSPYLFFPIEVHTNDPIKRRSEVYDFDGAVGYPFTFLNCRFSFIPLIGFSFHRQHLRVKRDRRCCFSSSCCDCTCSCYDPYNDYNNYNDDFYDHSSSSSSSLSGRCSSSCLCCSSSSSSDFCICPDNPFYFYESSNPFSSKPDKNIAHELGLCTHRRTSAYRFTWYGFYLGADLAYALDSCWTLYSELEFHFLDRCHRKRKSWTGVDSVDDYHRSGWAYGFNGVVGVTFCLCNCWYSTLGVDFRWWKTDDKRDDLEWKMVGTKIGLGYMF